MDISYDCHVHIFWIIDMECLCFWPRIHFIDTSHRKNYLNSKSHFCRQCINNFPKYMLKIPITHTILPYLSKYSFNPLNFSHIKPKTHLFPFKKHQWVPYDYEVIKVWGRTRRLHIEMNEHSPHIISYVFFGKKIHEHIDQVLQYMGRHKHVTVIEMWELFGFLIDISVYIYVRT